MQTDTMNPQTSAPNRSRGLLFLGLYAALLIAAFTVLTATDGLWVFFAPGQLTLIWAGGLLVLTLGFSAIEWVPPVLPSWSIWIGIVSTLIVAKWVLLGFENSADEYAYVFQAKTFLAGKLWNAAPPLGQALASDYTWVKEGKWVGQYPPGWPAILAFFQWCGVPFWAVNTGLSVGVLGLTFRLSKGSLLVTVLLALSPFMIFNGASYHSHMAAALMGLLAVQCLELSLDKKNMTWAVAAGAAVGSIGLIRYDSALLIALPFAISMLRQKRWALCAAVISGALPLVAVLLAYHWVITGNPLVPVYWLGGRSADHLYFDSAGIAEGIRLSMWRWVELVEWAGPGVIPIWVIGLAAKIRSKHVTPVDWVFPLFVLTFLFYPFDGANRYGPRYYFEALPFMVLILRGVTLGPVGLRLIRLSVVYGLVSLPFLGWFYHQIISERMELYDQVTAMKLNNAVVLVQDAPGHIWKMEPDDMARNGLTADGPVLYARADKVGTEGLRQAFPERSLWIYSCPADLNHCELRKL